MPCEDVDNTRVCKAEVCGAGSTYEVGCVICDTGCGGAHDVTGRACQGGGICDNSSGGVDVCAVGKDCVDCGAGARQVCVPGIGCKACEIGAAGN